MESISNVGSTNEDKMKLVSKDDKKKAFELGVEVSKSVKPGEKAESEGVAAFKLSKDQTKNSKDEPMSLGNEASIGFQTTGDHQPSICVFNKEIATKLVPGPSAEEKSIASAVVSVESDTNELAMVIELTVNETDMDKKK